MSRWFVIFKDFRALKLVFALMTSYLLYDEISIFISKPTFTSLSRTYLGPEHFPEIKVCPVPAFLNSELKRHGYRNSHDFVLGKMWKIDHKGRQFLPRKLVSSSLSPSSIIIMIS